MRLPTPSASWFLLLAPFSSQAAPTAHHGGLPIVPQCTAVSLRASFLAEETPGRGAGFLLELHNDTSSPVEILDPTPLSVHWYAKTAGRWLWRASSGSGGSLVNAFSPKGPVFATVQASANEPHPTRTIAAGGTYTWTAFSGGDPVLRYRPGCEHCKYPGEEQYQAVLAYAVLPSAPQSAGNFLKCGLRSEPVVMPPLPDPQMGHNSGAR